MMKHLNIHNMNFWWILVPTLPAVAYFLWMNRYSAKYQFQTVLVFAIFYLIVAVLYHIKDKSLTLEITLEYILTAALGLLILQSFLF
jgi:hypothetical protein